MKSIYKYQLEATDEQSVDMPKGASILSVQVQRRTICIWALVDETLGLETRVFKVFGTGHPIHTPLSVLKFIGTVQLLDGELIFHVFEKVQL